MSSSAVDTHAHIYWEDYVEPVEDILARADEQDVKTILVPGTNLETSAKVTELVSRFPGRLYGAAGIHPSDVKDTDEDSYLSEIRNLALKPGMVAIGEIGLDYYWDKSFVEKQKRFFHEQIKLAIQLKKPVIIHNRNSDDDLIDILNKYKGSGLTGVFHCFSGDRSFLEKALATGFYISLAGPLTFKNSKLKDLIPYLPLSRLLTETDSPFLSPHPMRGKRNEPAYVTYVIKYLAELYHVTEDDINRNVTFNTWKLFGIGEKPQPVTTYEIGHNLYVNLTNRCSADCVFCDRKDNASIQGYNLKIDKEPSAEDILSQVPDPKKYHEIVFCGYGEPTIRLDVLKTVAAELKLKGASIRLNTNGHGNIINKRNILPELQGLVDKISISLNSLDEEEYNSVMRLPKGKGFYQGMIDFARDAKSFIPDVTMSVVAPLDADVSAYRNFAEKEVGVHFRHRPLDFL